MSTKSRSGRWTGRAARFLISSLLTIFGLVVIGALLPAVPVLGSIGPLLISPFGSWIVILSLAGGIAAIARWRRHRRRLALVMTGVAAFAAVGRGSTCA